MNAPTGTMFAGGGGQEYQPAASGSATCTKTNMAFEQHSQPQMMQAQHMTQMPYGPHHQVINQGPSIYQVCLHSDSFMVHLLISRYL